MKITSGRGTEDLLLAAQVVALEGLVNAFGHVSSRDDQGESFTLVPPPLQFAGTDDRHVAMNLTDEQLPAGMPGEAWIHQAIYLARPDVGAICRAQPPSAMAAASAGIPILALHGHGVFVGNPVPVHDDARLVRSRGSGDEVAAALGDGNAVLLRGNGAVTAGRTMAEAVARMWALEASAKMNLATGVGHPRPLSEDEVEYWKGVEGELLPRIWNYLVRKFESSGPQPSLGEV